MNGGERILSQISSRECSLTRKPNTHSSTVTHLTRAAVLRPMARIEIMKYIVKILCIVFMFECGAFSQSLTQSAPSPAASPSVSKEPGTPLKEEVVNPKYVSKKEPVRIPQFTAPPVIDGVLNDEVWKNAAVFGDFLQTSPGDNIAPTHPTEFMIAYDSKNLYMAWHVTQDPSTVRATVARRDNIFNDDYVLVYIDTFNDQRQAYVIFWNPLGIQADGTYTEGRGEDYSVDLVMESKGVLTKDGFTIEASVPFKSLQYEAGKDKQWGLHIYRRIKWNNNELDSWQRGDRSASGSLNRAGRITGLEEIATTRQIEIIPSFTVSQSSRRSR